LWLFEKMVRLRANDAPMALNDMKGSSNPSPVLPDLFSAGQAQVLFQGAALTTASQHRQLALFTPFIFRNPTP
jgi:hypothetical protein